VFGIKNVEWTSVLISRIMPRPDLMPLTGGYRRTPVMQIGAGKVKVLGEIVALSSRHIAIRRHDPRAGELIVHFSARRLPGAAGLRPSPLFPIRSVSLEPSAKSAM
jgi:hypothetical protein